MLKEESDTEISILHRQGESIRGIALQLGVSRNTVRAYLRQVSRVIQNSLYMVRPGFYKSKFGSEPGVGPR